MFVVLNKKTVIAASVLLIVIAVAVMAAVLIADAVETAAQGYDYTVVLDAGHGGVDSGVNGVTTGNKESDINLAITKEVASRLEAKRVRAVLTRTDENGLYGDDLSNFKRRDMESRRDTIAATAPSLVVSIHCNKFPDRNRRGAQCFYEPTSQASIALARRLQATLNPLNQSTVGRTFDALSGDYYMLKCCTCPAAIVECGFLSNPEDDALLATAEHRAKIADAIVAAICDTLTAT